MPVLRPAVSSTLLVAFLAACGGKSSTPPPPPPPRVLELTSAWQRFLPTDYSSGRLTVQVNALAAGDRLAVLLVNSGGDDNAPATVTATGTADPALPSMAPLALAADGAGGSGAADGLDRADVMAGEAMVSALRQETTARLRDGRLQAEPQAGLTGRSLATAPAAAAALPASTFFCQGQFGLVPATTTNPDGFGSKWSAATLYYQTAHAAFYATNEVAGAMTNALAARPDYLTSIGAAYESKILTALNTYFGPESDVDGNGKMIFLFANLGKNKANSFPVGYFWPGDLVLPQATAITCPNNNAGNQADMLYLLDPGNFTTNWAGRGAYTDVLNMIVDGEYPSTMAHELQHNVNFTAHGCVANPGTCLDEEIWLNEGLSMVSETVAGYGLHMATNRANVRSYQGFKTNTSVPYYQAYSMTTWEADPYGNYAGVQAYLQYLLDHASPAMTKALENPAIKGKANVEAATGVAWDLGFARFTTAAMFSNEDKSLYATGSVTSAGNVLAGLEFNYVGDGVAPDYVPWHQYTGACGTTPKLRAANVAWNPVATSASVNLRKDGWSAFATGPGSGGVATITVDSAAVNKPQVVVVKYTGKVPNAVPATCP